MPIVDVDKLKRSGQQFASGFTPGQKVMSVLGIAGLVLAMTMFTKWSSTASYSPLFTGLSSKDAGDVTKALDGMHVPYKLTNGGASIEVPQPQLYKTRVDLSAKGLPAGNDGFSIIDKGGITQSKFQQDISYQRAIQTELANTIMAVNGVQHATVNLALPNDDPFVGDNQKQATAAVQIDTGSMQMPSEEVQAVVHLVSSSVKNLAPNGITVTDTNGNLLYSADQANTESSAQNLSKKIQYENMVRTKLEHMIAQSLGPGHAAVSVTAEMDFSSGKTVSDTQTPVTDPKTGLVVPGATHDKNEKLTNTGAAGTNGNLGGNANATSSKENYTNNDKTSTNTFNTQHTELDKTPGTVTGLMVSVALDNSSVKTSDIPNWKTELGAAAGILAAPNYSIVVQPMPMDKQIQKDAIASYTNSTSPKTVATPLDIMGIARYALTFLIIAVVLFLAWRSIKKAQKAMAPVRVPLDLASLDATQAQQYALELQAAGVAAGGELHAGVAGALGAGSTRQIESSRSKVELEVVDLIERQPEEVAQTLRSWLADRRV